MFKKLALVLLFFVSGNGAFADSYVAPANGWISVPNKTALAALPFSSPPTIRVGFATAGDSPPVLYVASSSACSLNFGAGDNGSQVKITAAGGGCWNASFSGDGTDIRDWGAACNWATSSGTDDHVAINAAVAYSVAKGRKIIFPAAPYGGGCYSSIGIAFANAVVGGSAPIVPTNPPSGPTLVCPASIAGPCATFGTSISGTDYGAAVRDLAVTYYGTPVSGDTAFLFQGFNTAFDDVLAWNTYDAFTWANGIASHGSWLYTWNVLNRHIIQNGFPEVVIDNLRLGMNGTGDQASSTAFFGITGADPNTLVINDCQANLGSQSPKYFVDFFSLSSQVNGIYNFDNCVVDMSLGRPTAIIHSDGTGTPFRFIFSNSTVNAPAIPMFSLSSAARMQQISIHDDNLFVSSFTMPSGVAVDGFRLANLYIGGTLTVAGTTGSIADISNVEAAGAITISGAWSKLDLANITSKTSYADTATGRVYATNVPAISWTPTLKFGGANSGMTTSGASGTAYRMSDGTVRATFGLTLTAAGSSIGAVTVTGMPYTCGAYGFGQIETAPLFNVSMSGLTGQVVGFAYPSTSVVWLGQQGAAGLTQLTNSNFTNSSTIAGTARCQPQ